MSKKESIMENAVLIFKPLLTVRGERVAEVLGISVDQANLLLSHPGTKDIIQTGLHRVFQETIDIVLQNMALVPIAQTSGMDTPRRDCAVALPELPQLFPNFGG
jgi:hypothetical protein